MAEVVLTKKQVEDFFRYASSRLHSAIGQSTTAKSDSNMGSKAAEKTSLIQKIENNLEQRSISENDVNQIMYFLKNDKIEELMEKPGVPYPGYLPYLNQSLLPLDQLKINLQKQKVDDSAIDMIVYALKQKNSADSKKSLSDESVEKFKKELAIALSQLDLDL